MITNTGKSILAKYLIGQAPAYASYIAIGCGPRPVDSGHSFTNPEISSMSNKTSLDFEMQRVPITSRGYVKENGVSKIVFTAELDSTPRYEISEVGVFSVGSNTANGAYDSKSLFSWANNENWKLYTPTSTTGTITEIPQILDPLSTNSTTSAVTNNILGSYNVGTGGALVECPVIKTSAENTIFNSSVRIARNERSRFLNETVLVRGDSATITKTGSRLSASATSKCLIYNGVSIDLTRNSSVDELKLAFSIVNKNETGLDPEKFKIILEFASTDGTQTARMEIDSDDMSINLSSNRYFVVTKQLQELFYNSGATPFSWNSVNLVKAYASVFRKNSSNAYVVSSDYYVSFDGLRLENKSTSNPLYGLAGYSIVKNIDAKPIVKQAAYSGYIEFRFAIEVQ